MHLKGFKKSQTLNGNVWVMGKILIQLIKMYRYAIGDYK